MNQQIAKSEQSAQPQTALQKAQSNMWGLLRKMEADITRALPKHVTPERMMRIAANAFRRVPDLAFCTEASVVGSILQAAQLGLEPNTQLGLCYLIPFRNRRDGGRLNCELIVGYQGMIELAYRSGQVISLDAEVVREGDHFEHKRGTDPRIEFEERAPRSAPITGAWCCGVTKGGGRFVGYLSRAAIDERRKRSKAANSGPWVDDFAAMARKTAVRATWWKMPKSAEMQRVEELDRAEGRVSQLPALDETIGELLVKHELITPEALATGNEIDTPEAEQSTSSADDDLMR